MLLDGLAIVLHVVALCILAWGKSDFFFSRLRSATQSNLSIACQALCRPSTGLPRSLCLFLRCARYFNLKDYDVRTSYADGQQICYNWV